MEDTCVKEGGHYPISMNIGQITISHCSKCLTGNVGYQKPIESPDVKEV